MAATSARAGATVPVTSPCSTRSASTTQTLGATISSAVISAPPPMARTSIGLRP